MQHGTPVIMDIEASGFGKGSYPIEVGYALPDQSTYCHLIRPLDDWIHWDKAAEEVHGIARQTLFDKGHSADEIAAKLNHHLSNQTVYSDGWGNDISWISLLFDTAGLKMQFRIESLNTLMSENQLMIWEDIRRDVIRDLAIKRHRASSDARIIQETYIRSRDKLLQQRAPV